VKSANYEVFSRSRLLLRLKGAGDQFAAAAGLPPSVNFLGQVAGTRSALAIYDIGNLQFLYITRLPSAKSMQSTLWQSRAKFEPRAAGGVTFYVRRDSESQREVAFGVAGDYLLLATREDLMAGALQLMSGSKNLSVESEQWWLKSVAVAGAQGDLRMVLDLEKLVPSPYFRTYWVQQNITDLKQYSAAVSDLFRSSKEYREERVLVRKTVTGDAHSSSGAASSSPVPGRVSNDASGAEAAGDLVRLVPDAVGIYEARANPSPDSCFQLLEAKLLAPHLGPAPTSKLAPQVQLSTGETGSGSDLETRIDQSPEHAATKQVVTALQELLRRTPLLASLQVQATEPDKAGVFVRMHSGVVLVSATDWDEAAVRSAIVDFIQPGVTASELGITWQEKLGYQQLDGLWPLSFSVRGKDLLVSDDPTLVESLMANLSRKPDEKPAVVAAGFSHARERENFARFSGLIDGPSKYASSYPANLQQPQFFSSNIASLSATLSGVSSESIRVREDGELVRQTVIYEWNP
jgi:hypothetical protein